MGAFVYMMASGRNGTIYVGLTTDLPQRAWQHRTGAVPGFTRQYGCHRLVWHEAHDQLEAARLREKQIKDWRRVWKLREIEGVNPEWNDLYDAIATP